LRRAGRRKGGHHGALANPSQGTEQLRMVHLYVRSTWRAGWLTALACLAPGCALLPPNSFLDPTKVGRFPLEYQESGIRRVLTPREGPVGLAANATEPTPEDLVPHFEEYRIGPTDTVALSIEDLLQQGFPYQAQLEVSPTGYIRIPLLGAVRVTGLTEVELEQELKDRLREAGLLPNPIVQTIVAVRRNRLYYITGAVQASGPYAISQPDLRLLDAIGIARDIGPDVKKLYVIRRAESEPGARETTPAAQPERELIIPPPSEENESAFDSAFFAQSGSGGATTQPSAPSRRELEDVLAPKPAGGRDEAKTEPGQRPFAPLVFDPESGTLREAPAAAPPAEEPPRASESATRPSAPGEFNWEADEDYELTQRVIEIDVRALKAGDPRYNIVVRDRDYINVPVDTGVFYVMGEVNRPGVYTFNSREITIKQAIGGIAGGLGPLAWPQRCEIIRREQGTDRQITIPVDVDAVFAGLQDDILLKDDDVVNVGTHVVAPFLFIIRNSFRFTYGFGFVYDRNFADKDAYGSKINPQTLEIQRRQNQGLPF
jgi:protein involved in polysaccharide export with SLBB domain